MWSALQNLWPFSAFTYDDLRASDSIVKKLPIPESTRHFVYAIREPESGAVIYVLSAQNLSERSALDAEYLIREVNPDAVVVQVGPSSNPEAREKLLKDCKNGSKDDDKCLDEDSVPTSVFEVLKRCFTHKVNREKYEDVAGNLVLREIFGVSFNGHFTAAKKAADEVGASFLILESPFVNCSTSECDLDLEERESLNLGATGFHSPFGLQPSGLASGKMGSPANVSLSSKAFHIATDAVQSRMVKLLSSYLASLSPLSNPECENNIRPEDNYSVPQFAKSVYPLLVDLHDIFIEIPSMKMALASAQKMFYDVNKGENINNRILSEVYAFQIAVEGLRIALNNAGQMLLKNSVSNNCEFCDLPMEDKSHAILAHALRSQTKNYKSIVAIIDASGLAGLRKHWNTNIPSDVKNTVDQLVTTFEDGEFLNNGGKKWILADKPVVAMGAGATAAVGASSLSKVIPASTFVKMATLHMPSSLKLIFTQTQKAFLFAFGPSKVAAPGLKGATTKAVLSAEKIRAVAHSMIASAEKTSLSAMRTAFYEIMRKRRARPIGFMPFATFGCSIATCAGLLVYGDGIECAAESFPAAHSIASLGRGIQSLHETSRVVGPAERSRIQKSIESLLYKCKNLKIQR
ncbi:TraB domain-containing protein [Striga asiatica]|uniref:TraB domain-containing protein n=1 Tax=Striga asiatica TaxID=4170 RepID=A0A5A7PG27_STRAF|nr:TraB domain-containing protein [Striga asiatica]